MDKPKLAPSPKKELVVNIKFTQPLADARNYPAPKLEMLPTNSGAELKLLRKEIPQVEKTIQLGSARNGLALFAKYALTPGATVLLPSYHCPSLVEPFIWANCHIKFYNVNNDLTPDFTHITDVEPNTGAIVLVRYFGWECDIKKFYKMAKTAGYIVIEDLAHAAHINNLYGDAGVTSLRKFYPVSQGAELLLSTHYENLVSVAKKIEKYLSPECYWHLQKNWRKIKKTLTQDTTSKFIYLNPREISEPIFSSSARELKKHNHSAAAKLRQNNFNFLLDGLRHSPAGNPLFTELSTDETPYVFPFLLHNANNFDMIRNKGLPLFRWEELAETTCKISQYYRNHLVQLPCHQDLTKKDLRFIIETINNSEEKT